jgi:ubiquitin-conjugating enzyme E2 S
MVVGKQIAECLRKGPDGTTKVYLGVRVIFNESNMLDVQADIFGPVDTPYEGGVFRCKLMIEADFPNNPPKGTFITNVGYFLTKIFHPNVSEKGEICVNTLKKDWNPQAWSLYNIL